MSPVSCQTRRAVTKRDYPGPGKLSNENFRKLPTWRSHALGSQRNLLRMRIDSRQGSQYAVAGDGAGEQIALEIHAGLTHQHGELLGPLDTFRGDLKS
jgi:hypothetical protein